MVFYIPKTLPYLRFTGVTTLDFSAYPTFCSISLHRVKIERSRKESTISETIKEIFSAFAKLANEIAHVRTIQQQIAKLRYINDIDKSRYN